jgi:hypothetical protein
MLSFVCAFSRMLTFVLWIEWVQSLLEIYGLIKIKKLILPVLGLFQMKTQEMPLSLPPKKVLNGWKQI